jgi:hypothetical protein
MKSSHPKESMHSVLRILALFWVLTISGGCHKPDPAPPNTMRNILGALRISDPTERDSALATACRESADQGVAPSVLMGLPRIENVELRDEVAEYCASSLDDAGQGDAAEEVAKLISDESKRKALLAKLSASS